MSTKATPPPHAARLAQLRAYMAEHRLDGFLVQNRMDQYWLTGFTGEDGAVLVTPTRVVLLTDGRFTENAAAEAPWARAVIRKKRGPEATAQEFRRAGAGRVGFDADHMPVSTHTALGRLARPAKLVASAGVVRGFRRIKDATEIAAIRNSVQIAERAMRQLCTWVRPGMTELEVAGRLVLEMQILGASEAAFGPIVAAGAGGSLPHYEPTTRQLGRGDPLLIDWGARAGWYVSDLTRVLWLGSIPPQLGEVYKIVREAHDRAVAVIRPGVAAGKVDQAARGHIRKCGYDKQFTHSTGHAIGLDVHEAPGLRKQATDPLQPGMVVTVEPGIYLPGVGGVRLESDVLVTADGCEVLSTLPMDLPLTAA